MAFQADANEIIEDQAQTIAALYKENAILKSQLRAAERALEAHEAQHVDEGAEVVETVPRRRKAG